MGLLDGVLSAFSPASSTGGGLFPGGAGGAIDTGTTLQTSSNTIIVNPTGQLFDSIFRDAYTPENGGLNLSMPTILPSQLFKSNVQVGDSSAGFNLGPIGLIGIGIAVFLLARK